MRLQAKRELHIQTRAPLLHPIRTPRRAEAPSPCRQLQGVRRESGQAAETRKYTFDEVCGALPSSPLRCSAPARASVAQLTEPQLRSRLSSTQSSKPPILVDVREPHELQQTGHIPGARNLPVTSLPSHLFLPADEFEDALGWPKPVAGDEVVFYCKSGVRSRAAANMVLAEWGKDGVAVGEFPGSWLEWEKRGGQSEKD